MLRLRPYKACDAKRGMGYGKEMLKLSLKYAFEILKVKKVTLGVFWN